MSNEEKIDSKSSGDESDDELMPTDMLEYIRNGSQSHTSINRREEIYKIRGPIKQGQEEWNMGKGLHKLFKAAVDDILQLYQFWMNLAHKFITSFQNLEFFQKWPYYQRT